MTQLAIKRDQNSGVAKLESDQRKLVQLSLAGVKSERSEEVRLDFLQHFFIKEKV